MTRLVVVQQFFKAFSQIGNFNFPSTLPRLTLSELASLFMKQRIHDYLKNLPVMEMEAKGMRGDDVQPVTSMGDCCGES